MDSDAENISKDYAEFMANYIEELSEELGVSQNCAHQICYLRTRRRWTQELEDELIQLHKEGNPPDNIFEFGVTEETQRDMGKIVDKVKKEHEDGTQR